MRTVISAAAEADLEQIGDYIARDNPHRAISFIEEIRARCLTIAKRPKAFPLMPRFKDAGIRRKIYGRYLICFRVKPGAVEIIRVLHGARNFGPGMLFDPEPE